MRFGELSIGKVFCAGVRGFSERFFIKISDTHGIRINAPTWETNIKESFWPNDEISAYEFQSQRADDIPEYGNRIELTYLEDESCECDNEPDQEALISGATSKPFGEPSINIGSDVKLTITNWEPILRTSKLSGLKTGDIFSFEHNKKDPHVLLEGIGGEFNFLRLSDGVKLMALNWMWDSITVYVIRNGVKNEI